MLLNMIDSLPYKYQDIYVIQKDNYKFNRRNILQKTDRNVIILGDDID